MNIAKGSGDGMASPSLSLSVIIGKKKKELTHPTSGFDKFHDSRSRSLTPAQDLLQARHKATSKSQRGWILLQSQRPLPAGLVGAQAGPAVSPRTAPKQLASGSLRKSGC